MSLSVAIRHRFGGFALDAAFEAPPGITVLFGRSGSGKTTLVNAVAGLLRPDDGRIAADGEILFDGAAGIDVPVHRRRVGYVFQDGRLFPHLSVRQNLHFGRWLSRPGPDAADPRAVADLLGIGHLLDRRPRGLSGGERQRVAIGRALLAGPRLLLMDEPLASLDDGRKGEILPYLERLRDEMALPILYVTHALGEVARLATTLVLIEDGKIQRAGPAAALLSDADIVPVLGVRAAGALLRARVVAHDRTDDLTELATGAGPVWLPRIAAEPGTWVRLRVAAHDLILSAERPAGLSALNVLPVRVTAIRTGEGPGAAVVLQAGEDRLLARVTQRSLRDLALKPGKACFAIFKATAVSRDDIGGVRPAR